MIAKAYFLNVAGNIQEDKIESYIQESQNLEKAIYHTEKSRCGHNALDLSNISAEIISLKGYLEKVKMPTSSPEGLLNCLQENIRKEKLTTQDTFNPVKIKFGIYPVESFRKKT